MRIVNSGNCVYRGGPVQRGVARRVTRQKSGLPKCEIDICLRVKEARNIAGVSQEQLSSLIGIPRDRLSTYEKCRSPIKFDLGLRICRQLIISEEWLATGETKSLEQVAPSKLGPSAKGGNLANLRWIFRRQCYDLLSDPLSLRIAPGSLFSDAFRSTLSARYFELAEQNFYQPRIMFTDTPEPELASRFMTVHFERGSFLLGHLSKAAGRADSWLIQRNYLRAMWTLSFKAFREFHNLNFDIAAYQALVRELDEWKPPTQMTAAKAKTKQAA